MFNMDKFIDTSVKYENSEITLCVFGQLKLIAIRFITIIAIIHLVIVLINLFIYHA